MSQNIARAAANKRLRVLKPAGNVTTWMAGTSPAMTLIASIKRSVLAHIWRLSPLVP